MDDGDNVRNTTNWLLLGLSVQERSPLWALFHRERLAAKQYLERSGSPASSVWFVESGVVSSLETGDLRDPIEVGVIGREGMIGTSAIAGLVPQRDSLVQIAGEALVADCAEFQACVSSNPALRSYLYRYIQAQMVQISLAASAGARASIEQRLARKLLMFHDRADTSDLPLTHESMSLMLGVRRASVTLAVHALEAKRYIRAQRGLLTILDRLGLERHCGPFYGVAEARYDKIMGWPTEVNACPRRKSAGG
jgi:CRP-like cAMP-binding protein